MFQAPLEVGLVYYWVGSDTLGSVIVSVALTSGVVILEKISDNCLNASR